MRYHAASCTCGWCLVADIAVVDGVVLRVNPVQLAILDDFEDSVRSVMCKRRLLPHEERTQCMMLSLRGR